MNAFNGAIALVLVGIMCATAMQSASACGGMDDFGADVDIFMDSNGVLHKVWRERVNGTFQVFYERIDGRERERAPQQFWPKGMQVSHSAQSVQYPQIYIDSATGICYVTWHTNEPFNPGYEHGYPSGTFWYSGSMDFANWTDGRYGVEASLPRDNPVMDMYVESGIITISWKHDNTVAVEADLDGDFLPDLTDPDPFNYNMNVDEGFDADVVAVNGPAKVSVAIDYSNDSETAPSIMQIIPSSYLSGSIGLYVDIEVSTSENFSANIKFNYDPLTLPSGITEKYLRVYWYSNDGWRILYNYSQGENTGIDLQFDYVWGSTTHFSTFTIADSSQVDSDDDCLTDADEIDADGTPDSVVTQFVGATPAIPYVDSAQVNFDGSGTQTVTFEVPAPVTGFKRASVAVAAFTGELACGSTMMVPIKTDVDDLSLRGPEVSGDMLVWNDNRNGNDDVFLYNIDDDSMIQISTNTEYDGSARISGNYVIWMSGYASAMKIMLYDISTGIIKQISIDDGSDNTAGNIDIDGDVVVWTTPWYLKMHEISQGVTTILLNGQYGSSHVNGDRIAYTDYTQGGAWIYTISTGVTTRITEASENPFLLDIDSNYVLYQDLASQELYAYNIATCERIKVTNTASIIENDPAIDGGIAVWTDYRNDDGDIYAYDLELQMEYPVCVEPNLQNAPSISEGRIVWQDCRETNYVPQIYMRTVGLPQITASIDGQKIGDRPLQFIDMKLPDFSVQINTYMREHVDLDDGKADGNIAIPLTFYTNANGWMTVSNLDVEMYVAPTDPVDEDSDDDGLNDGEEVLTLYTNPAAIDTDSDGILDGEEKEYWVENGDALFSDFDEDGLKNNLLDTDSDGDGVNDGDEITIYCSNPGDSDTDNDDFGDGNEILFNTLILDDDSDNDGLLDGKEIIEALFDSDIIKELEAAGIPINEYFSDPLDGDTDDDGWGDLEESQYWSVSIDIVEVAGEVTTIADPLHYDFDKDSAGSIINNMRDSDTDNDGLTDGDEIHLYSTLPYVIDTDGDALTDYSEIGLATLPMDSDSDNDLLEDGEEVLTYGTDPNDEDTDDDGTSDYYETVMSPDSDSDGLTDYIEENWVFSDSNDRDSDDDGLSDGFEYQSGTQVNNRDSDGDGLVDGWIDADLDGIYDTSEVKGEVGYSTTGGMGPGGSISIGGYYTSPKSMDSDSDGLVDGWADTNGNGIFDVGEVEGEIGDAINGYAGGYHTQVTKADTDGDGLKDGDEVNIYFKELTTGDIDGDGILNGPLDRDSDNDNLIDGTGEIGKKYKHASKSRDVPASVNAVWKQFYVSTGPTVGYLSDAYVELGVTSGTGWHFKMTAICKGVNIGEKELVYAGEWKWSLISLFPRDMIARGCYWKLSAMVGGSSGVLSTFIINIFESSSPTTANTDGDGWNDNIEILSRNTDPTLVDTDDDDLPDDVEIGIKEYSTTTSPSEGVVLSWAGIKYVLPYFIVTKTFIIGSIAEYGAFAASTSINVVSDDYGITSCSLKAYSGTTLVNSCAVTRSGTTDLLSKGIPSSSFTEYYTWKLVITHKLRDIGDDPSGTTWGYLSTSRISLSKSPSPLISDTDTGGDDDGIEFDTKGTQNEQQLTKKMDDSDQDMDNDGLINDYENEIGTFIYDEDFDNDDLWDGDEVFPSQIDKDGIYTIYPSNPLLPNSDDDELNDKDEAIYGSNPKSSHTDMDGLTDSEEVNLGTSPSIVDSDLDEQGNIVGDGLYDGWVDDGDGVYEVGEDWGEVGDVLNQNGGIGTQPLVPDTDQDGLLDGQESFENVNWIELENFASHSIVTDVDSFNEQYVYNIINSLSNPIYMLPEEGQYKLMCRIRDPTICGGTFGLSLSTGSTLISTFLLVTAEYEWVSTRSFYLNGIQPLQIMASPSNSNTIQWDCAVLIPVNMIGQVFTSPFISDMDMDGLIDGSETVYVKTPSGTIKSAYWYDAEEHVSLGSGSSIIDSRNANEGKAVIADDAGQLVNPASFGIPDSGDYQMFIRAKREVGCQDGIIRGQLPNSAIFFLYPLTTSWTTYITQPFYLDGLTEININLYDELFMTQGIKRVVLDQIALIPVEFSCITNPCNDDTDGDYWLDYYDYYPSHFDNVAWQGKATPLGYPEYYIGHHTPENAEYSIYKNLLARELGAEISQTFSDTIYDQFEDTASIALGNTFFIGCNDYSEWLDNIYIDLTIHIEGSLHAETMLLSWLNPDAEAHWRFFMTLEGPIDYEYYILESDTFTMADVAIQGSCKSSDINFDQTITFNDIARRHLDSTYKISVGAYVIVDMPPGIVPTPEPLPISGDIFARSSLFVQYNYITLEVGY